jgi:hypothetical protein
MGPDAGKSLDEVDEVFVGEGDNSTLIGRRGGKACRAAMLKHSI